ncbi:MAG: hypothetical protein E6Q98_09790 [Rhodospirillaceae bacterium]|nr:MAG: hypothetical protein E6Q98_09790 [Rhodospirillaceae bacterium]
MFARIMSRHPERFKQKVEVVPAHGSPTVIAGALAARIDVALADPNVTASTLIVPAIDRIATLAETALQLGELPKWSVEPMFLDNTPIGKMVGLRIARNIPFGATECPSELLVLGPFDVFPATRRAPVTAFEFFVGEPMPFDPKMGTPITKANLAHMELDASIIDINKVWGKSVQGRRSSLGLGDGEEDARAKAKVAFAISPDLARQLGCEP